MSKTFDQGKKEVEKLCRHFTTNRQAFFAPGIKEADIRQSLIDPFFEALGWDVRSSTMVAPQYREVIFEESVEVEGHQRAPDYTFRVGTLPKFYAEAKKCGVNIGADPVPAYQLRRYGWSARLALSILTDFEELAVYDCTLRPKESDKASHARVLHFDYTEYPDRWRELWDVFSREAVWSGAFDQYAASKRKRGTSEVDAEFLKEIERWRDALARNIALRNKDLSSDDLNAAVQSTIDRVVFLRMAEDRGLEPSDQLLKLCERDEIYPRFMRDLCRRADEKYNSGLFHFQKESDVSEAPDRVTPKLAVDDKVFKPILESLYFAHGSPYHFGLLPVEILGTVYERFLGKVIRLTAGHQAKVEEKPEVRKAGGVYYTPAYIVDYIVKHTVGRHIEGKSPAQLAGGKGKPPFRVLDMACGSGSFLLGAYQCLLDHCLAWYVEHKPETHNEAVYKAPRNGHWLLTIGEKKRIVTTHLFGVDIDAQAVEVTKLSLLLKVLEGETDQSVTRQQRLFHDRALPNLSDNIKCGNSLIGSGYFTGKLISDPHEVKRVNPFDWTRGFPDAMNAGGFDCIIGNPPWVSLTGRFGNDICPYREMQYLIDAHHGNTYMPNMYEYFVSQGVSLIRNGGRFGYIVPDRLGFNRQFVALRKRILESFRLISLVYRMPFPKVTADTLAFILERGPCPEGHKIDVSEYGLSSFQIPQRDFVDSDKHEWLFFADARQMDLAKRIASNPSVLPLSRVCKTTSGYGGKSALVTEHRQNARQISTLKGDSIVRYVLRKQYWFEFKREHITGRTTDKRKLGARPKILLRKTGDSIVATYDDSGIFPEQSLYFLFDFGRDLSAFYVLGLLNSRFMNWYYKAACLTNKDSIAQVKKVRLDQLPIRMVDIANDVESATYNRMVSLVEAMLALHKHLATAQSEAQRSVFHRQIDATDADIDRLVYDLYGLTAEEIAIVEQATT
ncbi:MAG: Eco57I restriction-modification methylase domain-containing protein [Pirellulales bacterium]